MESAGAETLSWQGFLGPVLTIKEAAERKHSICESELTCPKPGKNARSCGKKRARSLTYRLQG